LRPQGECKETPEAATWQCKAAAASRRRQRVICAHSGPALQQTA
jgi:hypothetical protein